MRPHLFALLLAVALVGCNAAGDSAALRTRAVDYQVDGNTFEGYLVRGESAGLPADREAWSGWGWSADSSRRTKGRWLGFS
jgi:hypothetical protein